MDSLKGAKLLEERFGGCTASQPVPETREGVDDATLPLWQWITPSTASSTDAE